MEILIKADMVTDAMVSTDCEIEDLNLMDRDYREFGDRIIYFIDTTEMGPGTAIPQCLLYKNVFPEYRVGGLRNSARIKENTSLAEVFRYVKLLLGAEPGGQTGYADIVSKLVSGVAMKDVLSAAFLIRGTSLWPSTYQEKFWSTPRLSAWSTLCGCKAFSRDIAMRS